MQKQAILMIFQTTVSIIRSFPWFFQMIEVRNLLLNKRSSRDDRLFVGILWQQDSMHFETGTNNKYVKTGLRKIDGMIDRKDT